MSETAKLPLLSNRREIFVVACLAGTLVSAVSVSFVAAVCSECADVSKLAPVPGLNIIGAIFYCALLAAMIRFGLTSRIAAAISFAVGIHLSMSVVLAFNNIACIACLLCLLFIVSAGIAAIPKLSRRFIAAWTVAGILACSVAFFNQWFFTRMELDAMTRKSIGFSKWPKQATGPIVITVFASDTCRNCKVYKQELTLIQKRYRNDIVVKFRSPSSPIVVPTTVIGGKEPTLLIGKPFWNELQNAIETSIAKRRQPTLPDNH